VFTARYGQSPYIKHTFRLYKVKGLRMTCKLRVYITFDTFKGIVLLNPNTSVCLLYKQLHVSAICYNHNQAVYKNKMEIFTITRFEIS
jgi:hypothetical protein